MRPTMIEAIEQLIIRYDKRLNCWLLCGRADIGFPASRLAIDAHMENVKHAEAAQRAAARARWTEAAVKAVRTFDRVDVTFPAGGKMAMTIREYRQREEGYERLYGTVAMILDSEV